MSARTRSDDSTFVAQIHQWAKELGFSQLVITKPTPAPHDAHLKSWLSKGYHGEMGYLANHQDLRQNPALLHPGTQRIICVRLDCLPPAADAQQILQTPEKGYIARYALGRDYHKMMRKRLTQLGQRIEAEVGPVSRRAFVDSAPVLERGLACNGGMGWIGKNCMLINRQAGSWFLLGELFIDLDLPCDEEPYNIHCGRCQACHTACPTQAFTADYELDARRCISYLTIEYKGIIDKALRPLIGNRIFGCDDCQIACPWNRFARLSPEADFSPRHRLDQSDLITLFSWDEETFLERTAGSPIRRTGYESWLRNIAIALGNGPSTPEAMQALELRLTGTSDIVVEHVRWALERLQEKIKR